MKGIESRLDKHERLAEKELRKFCLQRQEEVRQMEKKGSVDLGVPAKAANKKRDYVIHGPILQRSSTDLRLADMMPQRIYPSASAEDCRLAGSRSGGGGISILGKRFNQSCSSSKQAHRPSLGQRLQKSSSSVLRAATSSITSSIPSRELTAVYMF